VVQRGTELGQIAKIVIGAQERVDRSEPLSAAIVYAEPR
jgi:hypothetical protein